MDEMISSAEVRFAIDGLDLKVTVNSQQGMRSYMEDRCHVANQPSLDGKELLYTYFGVFDGHGGPEAAKYTKKHLLNEIVSQEGFWSEDDDSVLKAIRNGFFRLHKRMRLERDSWPQTQIGWPSNAGTTASVVFLRRGKLFIGHVGDSGIVLGYQDPHSNGWKAKSLTKEHKPDSPEELERIQERGGKVEVRNGTPRVVWRRPPVGHKGALTRSTPIDEVPFLAVARSLGDYWSFNPEQNEFVVSPEPDTAMVEIDPDSYRCLILGSDGLWNMVSPQRAVDAVCFAHMSNKNQNQQSTGDGSPEWINPSKLLVNGALDRWLYRALRADNTTAVTVLIEPSGPPKAQVQNLPPPPVPTITIEPEESTLPEVSSQDAPPPPLPRKKPTKRKRKKYDPWKRGRVRSPHRVNWNKYLLPRSSPKPFELPNFSDDDESSSNETDVIRLCSSRSRSRVITAIDPGIQVNEISSSSLTEPPDAEEVEQDVSSRSSTPVDPTPTAPPQPQASTSRGALENDRQFLRISVSFKKVAELVFQNKVDKRSNRENKAKDKSASQRKKLKVTNRH